MVRAPKDRTIMGEPTVQNDNDAQESRNHERLRVEGEVTMRRAGKLAYRVHIYDLSPDGCRAEFVDRPAFAEQLWIKFDGMEALQANVRWIGGARAGFKFIRPIHPAVFDMLAARIRA